MKKDFKKLTLSEAQKGLKNKDFTASELADEYLDQIEKSDDDIHAYLEVFEDARSQAKKADEKIASSDAGVLTGLPLSIKDNILLEGHTASASSKMLENYKATYTAGALKNFGDDSVVFLGRTNMDEFAMGGSTETSAYGVTKNPVDMSRVPGGSSGGAAASVTGGMALAALGSDTGGSIRQPASFCGLVGLKPTYGTVSRSGLMAMASSFDQIGPITKTVGDAEILFEALKGNGPKDATTRAKNELEEKYGETHTKKKYTIGVPEDFLKEGVDEDVLQNFRASLTKLEGEGHEVRTVTLPNIEHALSAYYIIMPAEVSSNLARFDGIRYGYREVGESVAESYKKTRAGGFGDEVRRRILVGTYVLSAGYYDAYYNKAIAVRQLITEGFTDAFKDVDVVATPTTPTPAFKIGEKISDPVSMYTQDTFTVPANIAGIPAISLPSGTVERGGKDLPVGLHFMAPKFHEDTLFDIGKKFLGEGDIIE